MTLGSIRKKDLELIIKEKHKFAEGFMLLTNERPFLDNVSSKF